MRKGLKKTTTFETTEMAETAEVAGRAQLRQLRRLRRVGAALALGAGLVGTGGLAVRPAAADGPPGTDTYQVLGTSNIFAAGMTSVPSLPGDSDLGPGGGSLPAPVPVVAGTWVRFPAMTGKVSCVYVEDHPEWQKGPEGPCFGWADTNLTSIPGSGVSGIVAEDANMFLVGVFTANGAPAAPAPAPLNFSPNALGPNFTSLTPALNQTFFIGDGKTDGDYVQQFKVPVGATTLYLGFADGYNFQGLPSYYNDNVGSIYVSVETAQTLLYNLGSQVAGLLRGTLYDKVSNILTSVESGNLREAKARLNDFITTVNTYRGRGIDPVVADDLVYSAKRILTVIGYPTL